jgi:predicted secreted protein
MKEMETITLKQGESHLINLHGLGSAGYQWMLESCDPQVAVVKEVLHSKEEVAVPTAGSLGQTFKVIAIAPGHALLRFAQRRRFERGGEPHASSTVSLTVIG